MTTKFRAVNYKFAIAIFATVGWGALCGNAADVEREKPKPLTGRVVYKKEPLRRMTMYYPEGWTAEDTRPALVIFRCRIEAQREHFLKRGMVVIKPDTAPVNSGNLPKLSLEEIAKLPKPRNQVEDTKSAIRYIRANAASLGVDPSKIVATGTSGGGDLALQSHLNPHFVEPSDDLSVSCSPDVLVLYCPAFDGLDLWFVKSQELKQQTKANAPAFVDLLEEFAGDLDEEYAKPLDHRATLIEKAATLGGDKGIDETQIVAFQKVLELFNERDWQLLHPVTDARRMSASALIKKDEPLPPTLMLFGDRDHLKSAQENFVKNARAKGLEFEMKIYKGGGHSFMTMPAFQETSTMDVDRFLVEQGILEK